MRDLDMLGAEHLAPSEADIRKFQFGIQSLPQERQEPEFRAMTKAIVAQDAAFGVYGPTTKAAAAKFNKLYSRDQGAMVDSYTLAALDRADLKPGYDEKAAALAAKAKDQAERAAAAKTPAQTAEVKKEMAATLAQAKDQAVTPEQKKVVAIAQEKLQQATTPEEVQVAVAETQRVTEKIADDAKPKGFTFKYAMEQISSHPVGTIAVVGSILGLIWLYFKRKAQAIVGVAGTTGG